MHSVYTGMIIPIEDLGAVWCPPAKPIGGLMPGIGGGCGESENVYISLLFT